MIKATSLKKPLLFTIIFIVSCIVISGPIIHNEGFGENFSIGSDAPDYMEFEGGPSMTKGHFFTLLISSSLAEITGEFSGLALVIFFALFFFLSFYYFMKIAMNGDWYLVVIPLLLVFSTTMMVGVFGAALYGQIFSLSLFLISMGLFFRDKKTWSIIPLILSIISHLWTGTILYGLFLIYLIIYHDLRKNIIFVLPIFLVIPLFGKNLILSSLKMASFGGKSNYYNTGYLLCTNVGLVIFAIIGIFYRKRIWPGKFRRFLYVYVISIILLTVFFYHRAWRFWVFSPVFLLAVGGASEVLKRKKSLFVFLFSVSLVHYFIKVDIAEYILEILF